MAKSSPRILPLRLPLSPNFAPGGFDQVAHRPFQQDDLEDHVLTTAALEALHVWSRFDGILLTRQTECLGRVTQ